MTASPPPDWLQRANRFAAIEWLLSTTVHDANNMLQIVSGHAELVEELAAANEALAARGRSIGANARRASALLGELLAFARDNPAEPPVSDLKREVERALGLRLYAMRKLKIETAVAGPDGVRVRMGARDLIQIVVNLLVNAERAVRDRPGGSVSLTIDGSGERAALIAEDSGPGLPDAAGDPFALRIGENDGRLGIGLAVSRQLAERAGGSLTYAARPAGGAVFTLSLARG